jgi:hypothetical protein
MRRWFAIALVWSLPAIVLAAPAPSVKPPSSDVKVIESHLDSAHGLDVTRNPEAAKLIDTIRKNPAPYISLLGARLDPATIANGDDEVLREATVAASLLVRACGEAGRSLAAQRFDALHVQARDINVKLAHPAARDEKSRKADITQAQRSDRMIYVARAIVAEFTAAGDGRLRDSLVARFSTDDYVTQLASLKYFERATPDDPKVRALLRTEYESRKSAFYQSPRVRALIGPAKPGAKAP